MTLGTASALALAGLVALTFGADALVRGASRLAYHFGVSPLVVGLTVVAYGTSAPEIVASVIATTQGHGAVAFGNVVGSNVANIGLILGGTAIVTPLAFAPDLVRRELPILVAVTIAFALFCMRLEIGRLAGLVALVLLVLFNYLSFRWADKVESAEHPAAGGGLGSSVLWVVIGLGLLLVGAHVLVEAAVSLARAAGIPEIVIGITLVAVGTSVPELATSIVAGFRKEADLVVGNIVGSNLFNILGALGLSAALRPVPVDRNALGFELPALVGMTLAMAVFLYTGRRVVRAEGVCLLLVYAIFIAIVL